MVRILLADDHDVVRRGLREQLSQHEGWEICGEAANGRDAVKMASKLQPDVAVIDLSMPELNGLEATRQIRRELPNTEVLIFTMHETEQLITEVLAAGARGYVLKSDAGLHLNTAVEALAEGKPFFTSKVSEALLDAFLKSSARPDEGSVFRTLTEREREVVQMLAEGKSNKEIANKLSISVKTVETHRATVMRKLDINSIVELVHYAIRNQLVEV